MKLTHKKRNLHGQRKKLASPNPKDTNMLVFLVLGNAKVLSFALGDAKVPNANDFASQWNIGFSINEVNLEKVVSCFEKNIILFGRFT